MLDPNMINPADDNNNNNSLPVAPAQASRNSNEIFSANADVLQKQWQRIVDNYSDDDDDACWDKVLAMMELNKDGYIRLRCEVPVLDDSGQVVKDWRQVTPERSSYTVKKRKLALYCHHLALLCDGQELPDCGEIQGKRIKYDVSHLCSNSRCYRLNHLFIEPHAINLSRIGCHSEGCVHKPYCLVSRAKVNENIRNVYMSVFGNKNYCN